MWGAMTAVTANPSQFHLYLYGLTGNAPQSTKNPLQPQSPLRHPEHSSRRSLTWPARPVSPMTGISAAGQPEPRSSFTPILDPAHRPSRGAIRAFIRKDTQLLKVVSGWNQGHCGTSHRWTEFGFLGGFIAPGCLSRRLAGSRLRKGSPEWLPDGRYLSVWGREQNDPSQAAIFVVRLPGK